ncbi:UNKNOWN [Stylonychia lemnae]|uniref:Uncharacterized protein n=1 Tax=Stylonychia lemnae TaxID=5949 RepID=A0A077ZUD3_STYLE|nr:UNKNOWN [Stylonychia lemnae]|eukprot:CDW72900.1 UNKNOWN [Stylonychia lemnae]
MGERPQSHEDLKILREERTLANKLREAISFCKNTLEISTIDDSKLSLDEKVNFEKCLTQNYLVKHGYDYFGKRDLIYLDLFGTEDIKRLRESA